MRRGRVSISGTWMQAAVIGLLAVIAFAAAWGHLESRQSSDHDLLLEVRSEARITREEVLSGQQDLRNEIKDLRGEINQLENRIVALEIRQRIAEESGP